MVTRVCSFCGKEFLTYKCYDKRVRYHRYCSKECEARAREYNNTRESWKGGHIGKTTGYRYIRVDGKQIGEHILVAERMLGRKLEKGEVVHHINGDKLDNREENLVVMSRSEHQKFHRSQAKRAFGVCRRCGKERFLKARGMCNGCYSFVCHKGELSKW